MYNTNKFTIITSKRMCNYIYIFKDKMGMYFWALKDDLHLVLSISILTTRKHWSETNIFSRPLHEYENVIFACTRLRGINRKGSWRNWCRGKTMPKLALQWSKGQNDRKVSEITKRIIMSVKRNSAE